MNLAKPANGRSAFGGRRFLKSVVLLAVCHWLLLMCLAGIIFAASHIPPKAVNLDSLILGLQRVAAFLALPREFLLWLWPREATPGWLPAATRILNSLIWGFALAVLRGLWRQLTV
jgi:hypothetical protein